AARAGGAASGSDTPAPVPAGATTLVAALYTRRRWPMLVAIAGVGIVALGMALAVTRGRIGGGAVANAPAALTHDDSLRIANAVSQRVNEARQIDAQRAGRDRDLDSLRR